MVPVVGLMDDVTDAVPIIKPDAEAETVIAPPVVLERSNTVAIPACAATEVLPTKSPGPLTVGSERKPRRIDGQDDFRSAPRR
jgi:hypothetical protein